MTQQADVHGSMFDATDLQADYLAMLDGSFTSAEWSSSYGETDVTVFLMPGMAVPIPMG